MWMQSTKAQAQSGRPLLDEPTDRPSGELDELGDLDDEEQAELDADLEASFEEEEAGQLIDLADAIADLRASK
jgi:hypothetical protein